MIQSNVASETLVAQMPRADRAAKSGKSRRIKRGIRWKSAVAARQADGHESLHSLGRERRQLQSDHGAVGETDDHHLVRTLNGNTFVVVSDGRGDIEASLIDPTGFFSYDTRFLSTWVLTVNGQRLNPLSVDDLQYYGRHHSGRS